jgi:hypothetical protein
VLYRVVKSLFAPVNYSTKNIDDLKMAVTEYILNADRAMLNTDRAVLNTDRAILNTDRAILNTDLLY